MSATTLPRPAQRVAIVSLLLVFLCGGVAGAMVMSFWFHGTHGAHISASSGMSLSIGEWKKQLDLTDDQTRKLTSILDDFSRYYDNLLADGNTRVREILTPEQIRKYEAMMRDHKH